MAFWEDREFMAIELVEEDQLVNVYPDGFMAFSVVVPSACAVLPFAYCVPPRTIWPVVGLSSRITFTAGNTYAAMAITVVVAAPDTATLSVDPTELHVYIADAAVLAVCTYCCCVHDPNPVMVSGVVNVWFAATPIITKLLLAVAVNDSVAVAPVP